MCIRDRRQCAQEHGYDSPINPDKNTTDDHYNTGVRFCLDHIEYVSPVSYTHLRAHETVLDLVCRLLLEKKNQHTKHIIIIFQVLINIH